MDINEFIENIASNLDDTDVDSFTPETKFHELDEWTSMMAISTMACVPQKVFNNKDLGYLIPEGEIEKTIKSIGVVERRGPMTMYALQTCAIRLR